MLRWTAPYPTSSRPISGCFSAVSTQGYEQISRLFDSLMQGYPFGTFLFWKVEPEKSGQFKFFGFIQN